MLLVINEYLWTDSSNILLGWVAAYDYLGGPRCWY